MIKSKRIWITVTVGLILLAVITVITVITSVIDPWKGSSADTTVESENGQNETTVDIPSEVDLGYGLRLVRVSSAAGIFPEDGKDEFVPELFCATIQNTTDRTLSIGRVELTINHETYVFEITSIPPGALVHAYEMRRRSAPTVVGDFSGECLFAAYREEEPTLDPSRLEIKVEDSGIRVKNLTDENIEGPVYIYYKSVQNDIFVGGITYRVKLTGLSAGDEVVLRAVHATAEYTRIMYVEYGE
jgi:hypothetical protein